MIATILAAAGAGTRFESSVPKQFLPLDGSAVYLHSLARFLPFSSQLIVVTSADHVARVREEAAGQRLDTGNLHVVEGGATRQASVSRGLAALESGIRWILVHDAARPFVSSELIQRVLEKARGTGACVPALPAAETVKEVSGGQVLRTLDRSKLVLVQTPQAFERQLLEKAFERAGQDRFVGNDEASLVEHAGGAVSWIEGEPWNIKITWPGDLESGKLLWQNRGGPREG